jgi:hypothetical protein
MASRLCGQPERSNGWQLSAWLTVTDDHGAQRSACIPCTACMAKGGCVGIVASVSTPLPCMQCTVGIVLTSDDERAGGAATH